MLSKKYPPGFFIETVHKHFTGNDPVFFDKSKFPWVGELERRSAEIIASMAPLFEPDFPLLLNAEDRFQFPPKIWKGYFFCFYGFKFKKHLKEFPLLAAELEKIPNLISANVSVLEPNSWLLPHNGATNGFIRCHWGLKVPAPLPDCGFNVGGQEVSWEEGKVFMFGDMNVHSAHNKTDERRFIMILDVIRPEYVPLKKTICAHILAKYLTNVTVDYMRKPFGVKPPRVDQDPEKGLSYVANEGYKDGEKLTIGQRIFRKIEDIMLQVFIAILSGLLFFKKMQ